MTQGPLIILTAAEASGDQHGSNLIRAIRARIPDARCVAMGGPRMADAGAELLVDLTSRSAMLAGSFARVPEMLGHYFRFDRYVEREPVALHIPIDSPTVNLPLAGRSRRHAVPVLYYIAPQLWAWGAWRTARLRARVRKLACILPFEEQYFRDRGIDAEFVGHPLFEPLASFVPDTAWAAANLPAGSPKVALLPGSRGHEIADHLPTQLRAASELKRRHPDAVFALAAPAPGHGHSIDIAPYLATAEVPVTVATGRIHDVLAWADAALVVSGSVTLEVARFGVPMVIMYRVKRWQWNAVGRHVVKTPWLSLVNILAARELVPELMPWFGDDREVIDAAASLLADAGGLARLREELKALTAPLAASRASLRTAELVAEIVAPH
ncbi:MAG: Lipid-A-disaccharide synthase [Phycisphaerae bacterium]|nr:Lipid-A-disaccharide synthase [Phycisphaerae bacterium]